MYFPRDDVEMAFFTRTDQPTYCPYKGEANYFTLLMDGVFAENAVWTYEDPYPAMDEIRELVAFYPNQVEIYEVGEATDRARPCARRSSTPTTAPGHSQKEALAADRGAA